jgi:carbonic anhydrase/acetyltransferase-like protein (isoleucine patch superfamily)
VTVNSYSGFGHDAEAGEFTTLSAHVDIMGFARIGSGVFIGSHASIMPHVKVGDGAKIGAGAIVYRSVPCRSDRLCAAGQAAEAPLSRGLGLHLASYRSMKWAIRTSSSPIAPGLSERAMPSCTLSRMARSSSIRARLV